MRSLLLWLVACGGPEPQLVAQREALDGWEAAVAALERGDPGASEAFAALVQRFPGEPSLLLWQAKAEAGAGDLQRALSLTDQALALDPEVENGRYNRACYRARAGDLAGAARDLRQVLASGAVDVDDILADPDLVPFLDRPELAFLPRPRVAVDVAGPEALVFWGSPADVTLRAEGLRGSFVVEAPAVAGPVELARVDERIGEGTHDVTWRFRVVGEGPVAVGPFRARVGDEVRELPPFGFETAAPADKRGEGSPPGALAAPPSTFPPPGPLPAIQRTGAELRVWTPVGSRVSFEPEPPHVFSAHLEGTDAAWVLTRVPSAAPGTRALVQGSGGKVTMEDPG